MNIYETIEGYLKEGKSGAIATVVARTGSAPRDIGARMFVGEDGILFGTIGGGRLEHDVYSEVMAAMGTIDPKVIHIRMDAKAVASDGMICGGNVDVFVEPALERYRRLYGRLGLLESRGIKGVLATRFGEGVFTKTLIEEDHSVTGDDPTAADREYCMEHLHDGGPSVSNGLVIEPLHVPASLYLFGAGHVSQFIAKVAKMVDFSVTVIDDREEFANPERFPDADEIIVSTFEAAFDRLRFTGREFAAIITRGHQHDADVLRETLKRQTRYTGMIGSKRKVKMIFDYMKEAGFDDQTIARVHAPIGLSIHAETPQEIAVSIVAEMIKIRGE